MSEMSCSRCRRVLNYSGESPRFCSFCGQAIEGTSPLETVDQHDPPGSARRGMETVDHVRSAADRAEEIPERLGDYRLIRQLGRGGMGTVFEAENTRLGRRVALKLIAPGFMNSQAAVDRFRQEGRLASTLAHPRCVFVIEADEAEDGRPFIAMDLMTGDTLQDLVEKGGPLEVKDAVAKILDVVEGLREAHRLGLIHRDVKPSNCFLDGDGRVKVGDFGLSRTQSGSSHLTRSGSFLGTPLYASPEQIRVEPLDERTDVYSTAATLFFLLTGRAPFDRGDAAATMARIVTEAAPSARAKRPEVPSGLDRAIRKGLERDLDRRFRDLDEFQASLLAFQPGLIPDAKLRLRLVAYLVDFVISSLVLRLVLRWVPSGGAAFLVSSLVWLAYFALGDGIWGGSPGKQFLRIKVVSARERELAGVRRSTLRALVFLALIAMPVRLFLASFWPDDWNPWSVLLSLMVYEVIGVVAVAAPMFGRQGRRGLHDLIGGTRVVVLPRLERRREAGSRRAIGRDRGSVTRPVGVMQSVGPYKVRGAVRWEPNRRVVSGEDSTLGREAWIVIRPKGSEAPSPSRREVTRSTRPRWLDGGEQSEGRWDAYIAPAGTPLADFAGPDGLPWRDARPILEDVADELLAACRDGTLPSGLAVDQVWVQPDGRTVLVDSLASSEDSPASDLGNDDRSLGLLRRVASLTLEGGRSRTDVAPRAIRCPIPLHASRMLDRLIGGPDAYPTVESFRDDLDVTRDLPLEIGRGQRITHLILQTALLVPGLTVGYLSAASRLMASADFRLYGGAKVHYDGPDDLRWGVVVILFFPGLWVVWDFLTRGGLVLNRLSGFGLVGVDGRKAPRWRCGWRSFLIWLPSTVLLVSSILVHARVPDQPWASWTLFGLALARFPIHAALTLLFPWQGWHNRLSGVHVVPK